MLGSLDSSGRLLVGRERSRRPTTVLVTWQDNRGATAIRNDIFHRRAILAQS